MDVAAVTVFGVVGTALFAMIFMQLQNLREDMREGFRTVNSDIKALEHKVTSDIKALEHKVTGELKAQGGRIDRVFEVLRDRGERLARIESRLEIGPPAEAA